MRSQDCAVLLKQIFNDCAVPNVQSGVHVDIPTDNLFHTQIFDERLSFITF